MSKYELIIYWSKEDNAFVVEVPELPGCMADGASYEAAVANAQEVISAYRRSENTSTFFTSGSVTIFSMKTYLSCPSFKCHLSKITSTPSVTNRSAHSRMRFSWS